MILFQNLLFLKEFLACNGFFRLFTKVKKGSGNSLWCTFSAWFSNKKVPYLILSMDKVSIVYLFSFLKYQAKCVIKFLFRHLMMSQTSRFIFNQPLKQWLMEKMRGNTKIQISRGWKELFRWNKKHFS